MMGKKWKSKFWEDDIPDMTKDEQFQNCLAELESGHLSSYSNSDDPDAEVIKRGHQTSVDLRTSPNPKVPVTPISPDFRKRPPPFLRAFRRPFRAKAENLRGASCRGVFFYYNGYDICCRLCRICQRRWKTGNE